jgi:hypothetical protein
MSDTSDTHKRKKHLLSYLKQSLGVVTTACNAAGVSRDSHYRWYDSDNDYKNSVDEINNTALDFVESKLSDTPDTSDTYKRKKQLLSYLKQSLGVVSTACDAAGISRDSHYRWYNCGKSYKHSVDKINNTALDFVESKLYESIKKGAPASIIFYLKTKGKSRGYSQNSNNSV